MSHRLAPEARDDFDAIWYNTAERTGNLAVPDKIIDTIASRFYLLGQFPRLGRIRSDLGPDMRSFPVNEHIIINTISGADVVILHVFAARRDIRRLIER